MANVYDRPLRDPPMGQLFRRVFSPNGQSVVRETGRQFPHPDFDGLRGYARFLHAGAAPSPPPASTRHASGRPNQWPQKRQKRARRRSGILLDHSRCLLSQAPRFREELIVESWKRSRRHLSISFWKRSRLALLEPLLENIGCWPVELVAAGGLQLWLSLFRATHARPAEVIQLANRRRSRAIPFT